MDGTEGSHPSLATRISSMEMSNLRGVVLEVALEGVEKGPEAGRSLISRSRVQVIEDGEEDVAALGGRQVPPLGGAWESIRWSMPAIYPSQSQAASKPTVTGII